jgi:cation transport protein ChaC
MALTADLVARASRAIENTGPAPDMVRNTETEWNATVREMLASRPGGQDVWIFAYGSLLWNPAVEQVEQRSSVVRGWHRLARNRRPAGPYDGARQGWTVRGDGFAAGRGYR